MSRTRQNRAYDHLYDPTFTSGRARASAGRMTSSVNGGQRYKYFRRPLVPYLQSSSPSVVFASNGGSITSLSREGETVARIPPKKTVGVQTMYRDSEAQTDPYTPNFVLKPGEKRPEVLSIAGLTFENGLPAKMEEVRAIEYERKKRAYEASLPPMTDELSFLVRRKMMERQERDEFNRKERDIEEQNRQRLEMMRDALVKRERAIAQREALRVESLRESKRRVKELFASTVHHRRIKKLRKLSTARRVTEKQLFKSSKDRDMIEEYTDYGSNVYAPTKRLGSMSLSRQDVGDRRAGMRSTLSSTTSLYQDDFNDTVPESLVTTIISEPRLKGTSKAMNTTDRKQQTVRMHLERTARMLDKKNTPLFSMGTTMESSDPNLSESSSYETTKKVSKAGEQSRENTKRPPTPEIGINENDIDALERDRALILLQRLLKGRAVQNMMHETRERNRYLIRELRYDQTKRNPDAVEQQDVAVKRAHAEWEKNEMIESTREKMVGEVVSAMFSYVSKNEADRKLHRDDDFEKVLEMTTGL